MCHRQGSSLEGHLSHEKSHREDWEFELSLKLSVTVTVTVTAWNIKVKDLLGPHGGDEEASSSATTCLSHVFVSECENE